jgi:hypothetical protein
MSSIPAPEWLQAIADETKAFTVQNVEWGGHRHSRMGEVAWDYQVIVLPAVTDRLVKLYIVTRENLTPRIALDVIGRMRASLPDGVPLLCSPWISPRVAELCREGEVSYLDAAGNCRIRAPGLFISISGRQAVPVRKVREIDVFSPKSSRIVRVLLTHPFRSWQVQELASEARVSLGLVSKVKASLLDQAFVQEQERRLLVRDPVALLQAWSAHYNNRARPVPLFVAAKPKEAEERVAAWCDANRSRYALTQFSGAWRTSPMVRYDRSTIYLLAEDLEPRSISRIQEFISGKIVDSGINLTLWLTEDQAVFYGMRKVGGVNVVSPLQLYLDLKSLVGRGEEAAQEVYERDIRPSFSEPQPTKALPR